MFKARGKRSRPRRTPRVALPTLRTTSRPEARSTRAGQTALEILRRRDDANENDGMKLPGKKKLKLRTKGAAEGRPSRCMGTTPSWRIPIRGRRRVVDRADEEGMLEMRMREKGTLSEDEDEEAAEEEEESEVELEDSEDDFDLEEELATKKPRRAATAAPAPILSEAAEEKEARMAKEKPAQRGDHAGGVTLRDSPILRPTVTPSPITCLYGARAS